MISLVLPLNLPRFALVFPQPLFGRSRTLQHLDRHSTHAIAAAAPETTAFQTDMSHTPPTPSPAAHRVPRTATPASPQATSAAASAYRRHILQPAASAGAPPPPLPRAATHPQAISAAHGDQRRGPRYDDLLDFINDARSQDPRWRNGETSLGPIESPQDMQTFYYASKPLSFGAGLLGKSMKHLRKDWEDPIRDYPADDSRFVPLAIIDLEYACEQPCVLHDTDGAWPKAKCSGESFEVSFTVQPVRYNDPGNGKGKGKGKDVDTDTDTETEQVVFRSVHLLRNVKLGFPSSRDVLQSSSSDTREANAVAQVCLWQATMMVNQTIRLSTFGRKAREADDKSDCITETVILHAGARELDQGRIRCNPQELRDAYNSLRKPRLAAAAKRAENELAMHAEVDKAADECLRNIDAAVNASRAALHTQLHALSLRGRPAGRHLGA